MGQGDWKEGKGVPALSGTRDRVTLWMECGEPGGGRNCPVRPSLSAVV